MKEQKQDPNTKRGNCKYTEPKSGMVQWEFTLPEDQPFHARLAARIAMCAQKTDSEVTVTYKTQTLKAQDVTSLLALGIGAGQTLRIQVEGPEADKVVKTMKAELEEETGVVL